MTEPSTTYRTVTPYLVVTDAEVELRFLGAAFGAVEQECHRSEDGGVMHAEVCIGDSLIMLGQAAETGKALAAALYLWVDNVDEVYTKALAAGARPLSAPEDKPYGHRNAGVVDSNGITWWIGSPVR